MQIWNKKHFWWKEQPQRPETKIVTVYIRGGKRAGVVGAEWAWREEEEDLEALVKPIILEQPLVLLPNSRSQAGSPQGQAA